MRVGRIDGEPGTFRVKLIPRDIANKALDQRTTSHFPLQFLCKKKIEMTAINGEGNSELFSKIYFLMYLNVFMLSITGCLFTLKV